MNRVKNLIFILMASIIIMLPMSNVILARAESYEISNGVYEVSYSIGDTSTIGQAMVGSYFANPCKIEAIDGHYYLTYTQTSSASTLVGLTLTIDGVVGTIGAETTYETDEVRIIRYTLSYEQLCGKLYFSAYVNAMNMEISYSITLDLDNKTYTGEVQDTTTDRVANYTPDIYTLAGTSYEYETGSVFYIPSATASINGNDCDVTYSVYLNDSDITESVSEYIILNTAGTYTIIYTAESGDYLTLLGNNSTSTYVVTIVVTGGDVDDVEIATTIQVSEITSGGYYDVASSLMSGYSDTYQVFAVSIYNNDENESQTITISADYTSSKVKVYLIENGEKTLVSHSVVDGKIVVQATEGGVYVVCIPGIATPKYVYMMIGGIVGLIVLAAAIVTPIVIIKKKKKASK